MNQSDREKARAREKPEPHESSSGIPRYVLALIAFTVCWGGGYIITSPYERVWQVEAAETSAAPVQVDGEKLYNNNCVACHQATGLGVPNVFPPLSRSEWVTGDPRVPVRILLHGLSGEISVAGTKYNGFMPAFGASLNDAEIAALASFIRDQWNNDAAPVDVQLVASERELNSDRGQPWNANELKDIK